MSRRNAAKKAVFSGLFQYFGFQSIYPTVVTFNITIYNTKTQKSYVKKDLKQIKSEKIEMVTFFKNL